jgi:predicted unusual protein kinase regulating ubiquinone biosynthesis (AarF/ABC1/UbiB family)
MPDELPRRWLARAAATGRVAGRFAGVVAERALRPGANQTHAGEAIVADLDRLKGLAMKVGQILSYMDVGLPDDVAAALARLQTGARAMEPAQEHAAAALAGDLALRVPRTLPERCAEAVLTAAWHDGEPFARLCAGPAEARNRAAATLARFPWTTLFGQVLREDLRLEADVPARRRAGRLELTRMRRSSASSSRATTKEPPSAGKAAARSWLAREP